MVTSSTLVMAHPRTSSALSMPGFLGVYFGVRVCLTFVFFQSAPQTGAIFSLAINLMLLLPTIFYTAGPASITIRQTWKILPVRFCLMYLALALISLAWSETASRATAFAYWSAMASDVLLVFLVLRAEPLQQGAESLLKGFLCGAFLLALVAWCAPANTDLRLGDDEFLNPNAIGLECAFGAILCQHLSPRGARWKWLGAALAITLLRSLSKTTIIAFVIAEAFYLVRVRSVSRSAKLGLAAAALLTIGIFWNLISAYYAVYLNASTQAQTLTGRTLIWVSVFGLALEEPWLGHGFHSFRTVVPPFGTFEAWHAHNEIIQQFFVFGIVGVILVIALYTSLYRHIRRYRQSSYSLVTSSFLLLVSIRGLADTERFDISLPLWMITALSLSLVQEDAHL